MSWKLSVNRQLPVGSLRLTVAVFSLLAAFSGAANAQRATLSGQARQFIAVDTTIVALTHARIIDGTGAAPRENQTLIIRDGSIAALGDDGKVTIPPGALVIDETRKSVIPGMVQVHEHLFYPTGPGIYGNLAESFTRLYLAGGVTSMRTGGNMNGYGDIAIARAIEAGTRAGPWVDATAPYFEGPGLNLIQVRELKDAADATREANFWADEGATSFKTYMHITRAELAAVIAVAHKRGIKVTGHLCSVTFHEAAELGIDNLEHGFFPATDFVAGKKPDECPGQGVGQASMAAVDPNGEPFRALVAELVKKKVALTSTLTVFETLTPGRPLPRCLDYFTPQLKEQFEQRYAAAQKSTTSAMIALFPKARAMEMQFVKAGGTLLVGTDPTGGGGLVPGCSDQRAIELLVESGMTPLEAIKVGTMNGATFLGRAAKVGSIAVGKQADLVVLTGNPAARIADLENVEIVFKQGIGYDPAKLVASVKGKVGLF
jgi:imidazolonepropionase-like amidohydrolase